MFSPRMQTFAELCTPPYLPADPAHPAELPTTRFFLAFFVIFSHAKKCLKIGIPKNFFLDDFFDFPPVRRRFSSILDPKTGPRRLLFRCFFENGDFLKIVLPLWWEHSFQGSDPPKIGPETDSERQRREKTQKIGSGAVSGRTFSAPDPFLVDFGVPAGSQNRPKTAPEAWDRLFFDDTFPIFLRFLRSGVFRKAPGAILEAPGTLPDQILIGLCDTFLLVKAGSCRGLSGSAGMLPGSAPNLSNPLSGVPLGYGDLAQRFK